MTENKRKILVKNEKFKKILGYSFIMSYNKLSALEHYWNSKESLSNIPIEKAMSRDLSMILVCKFYFSFLKNPSNSSESYNVARATLTKVKMKV